MEVRDWVQRAADARIESAADAVAFLSARDAPSNWSVRQSTVDEYEFALLTGDQWVVIGSEAEVTAVVVGVAIAVALNVE